jgi:hypothetical protein
MVSAALSCCVPGEVDDREPIVAQPATKPRAEDCKNDRREKSIIQQVPPPAPPGADIRRFRGPGAGYSLHYSQRWLSRIA